MDGDTCRERQIHTKKGCNNDKRDTKIQWYSVLIYKIL